MDSTIGQVPAGEAPAAPSRPAPFCGGALVMHTDRPGAKCDRCGKLYGFLGAFPLTCDARAISRCSACGYSGENDVHMCAKALDGGPVDRSYERGPEAFEQALVKAVYEDQARIDPMQGLGLGMQEIEDARLGRELVAILAQHAGERGDNEGAVEVLRRIIRERDQHVLPMGDTGVEYVAMPSAELSRLSEIEAAAKALDASAHVIGSYRPYYRPQEALRLCAAIGCGLAPTVLTACAPYCPPSRSEDAPRDAAAGAGLLKADPPLQSATGRSPESPESGLASRDDLAPGPIPRWKR